MPDQLAQLTRQTVRDIHEEILEAVQAIALRRNLEITNGGGTFDGASAVLKLKVALKDESGVALTPERRDLDMLGEVYGIADAAGKSFTQAGRTYTVTGLNTKATKNPVVCTRDDGKQFRYTLQGIQTLLRTGRIK